MRKNTPIWSSGSKTKGTPSETTPGIIRIGEALRRRDRERNYETDTVLERLTGAKPTLFRAPYGAVSADVTTAAAETGHLMIGWSVDTMDWDGKNVAQILAAVRKEGKPGSIVLQHSAGGKNGNLSNTVAALPQIISYFQKNGYAFVTVPELLSDK
ncbi:polysaccharide deacetylase family protein [Gordoniibacillus kamchatkensis]|uniref:polysaccharide deacetylase family protein n=1 Tax=Gordoniibacillus kamchatkensis TaxID=1590651 RepID=UPI0018CF0EC9|nr:polysaccharide deacetylase family protein [Paenibacillus sp. VKM B-2647]